MRTGRLPKETQPRWHPFLQEIEADRKTWLERVNIHLEKLLENSNREKNMLWRMKNHYWACNHVCKARIKILKAKLRRALKHHKRHDRLQILAEASLAQNSAWWGIFSPNFKKFGKNFVNFEIFGLKTGFSAWRVAPLGARLQLGDLLEEKFVFLDFLWKFMHSHEWPKDFIKFWVA